MATVTLFATTQASDLTGAGGYYSYKILDTAPGAGSATVSVLPSGFAWGYLFTEPNYPGEGGSPSVYYLELNVTSASASSLYAAVTVSKISASGTVISTSPQTAEQGLDSTGVKTFTLSASDLGAFSAGQRLLFLVQYTNRRNQARTVVHTFGTTDSEVLIDYSANPPVACSAATVALTGAQATIWEATPVSVECSAATVALTGAQATIAEAAPVSVECSAGTIVLAGAQASLSQSDIIPASAGTVVVSGETATITEASAIDMQVSWVVFDLKASGAIACSAGTIVVAGQQATIRETIPVTVECSVGTIVLAGQQATVQESGAAIEVSCTPGTIVLSGQQASITESVKTEVSCTFGLIVLGGEQATVTEVVPVPTNVECSAGTIVVSGTTATIEAASALRGRPRRRYVTYVEPTAPEVPGTLPTNHGAAFGSLAPVLPAPVLTPPLVSARPKLKLLKPKREPAPYPFADEPLPPPRKPHLVVIEGRGHVQEAVPPPVVDRVASALEQLASTIRSDPYAARHVTDALLPLLAMPESEDEEEIIQRLLLAGPHTIQRMTDALVPLLAAPDDEEEAIIRLLLQRGAA